MPNERFSKLRASISGDRCCEMFCTSQITQIAVPLQFESDFNIGLVYCHFNERVGGSWGGSL